MIGDYRKRMKLTQTQLGELVGMDKSRISDYENLRYVMKVDTAKPFADVFNCSIEELYEWVDDESSDTEG
ncbi:helix-turn-helix domain-containing protein [Niallia sp. FSL M8-0099]|uniref:helix-turn-helix domain-containing protein n=1 Tax=Niallia sp. FSL M8-0099 TaxID=2954519 RepID=UPI0030FAC860